MQTFTVVYESVLSFHFLPTEEINRSKSILIQIFSTYTSRSMLEKIAYEAQVFFPDAVIVGVSTSGSIYHKTFSDQKTIISITSFEKTRVASFSIGNIDANEVFEAGKVLAQKVHKRDTKLLLLFSDGLLIDSEELLNGITSIIKETPIAGTLAADHEKFFETFVVHDGQVITKGAALVALNGGNLDVTMESINPLQMIGPDLYVSSSEKNRVYKFNDTIALEVYAHYLGEAFIEQLPKSGLEIAIVTRKSNIPVARNIISLYEDGSLQFAGHIPEGSTWKFGYIATNTSFRFCPPLLESGKKVESYFVFCDTAHRLYNKENLYNMIDMLADIAETVGCFGYGEFFSHDRKNLMLNQSMVILGLSETEEKQASENTSCRDYPVYEEEESLLSGALSHLGSVMFDEFELQKNACRTLMEELPYGVIVYDKNFRLESFNTKARELLGLDIKLRSGKDLRRLDEWIVTLLERGFQDELYTQVGRVIDPMSGEHIPIRISTLPIVHEGAVKGAMAFIYKEEH